jgi:hypothetical protein
MMEVGANLSPATEKTNEHRQVGHGLKVFSPEKDDESGEEIKLQDVRSNWFDSDNEEIMIQTEVKPKKKKWKVKEAPKIQPLPVPNLPEPDIIPPVD